jgi:hypothetical protein
MIIRDECEKGFPVSFDYTSNALTEIDAFFRRSHKVIILLTVDDILNSNWLASWRGCCL